jgi:8-oxo-dGTP pyrophosphatase MutT (NUDIX family)
MEHTVWQGRYLKMTTEQIANNLWERAYLPEGVVVFPVTHEGKILVIRERRAHETPPVRLKPVTGMVDKDQTPVENAQRELQEEIGLKAHELVPFWAYKTSGTVNSLTHFFLAKNLTASKLPNPDGEDIIEEIIALTPQEIDAKVATEEMRWGVSVMGWFKLRQLMANGDLAL